MPTSQGFPLKALSAPLLISLVANALLVFALLLRGGNHNPDQPKGTSVVSEMTEFDARAKWEEQWKSEWEKTLPPSTPAMTEEEAKAKWEARWKSEWEKSLPQAAPAIMTEEEAKATWEARWKSEWEKALPPPTPDMTEDKARAKWEESWRGEWTRELRADFEKTLRASGGEWPVLFGDDNSPFTKSDRSDNLADLEDKKAVTRQRIYRSCKACADFIQTHLNP